MCLWIFFNFYGLFGFFLDLLRLLLKVTKVTTVHKNLPKQHNKLFLPKGQNKPSAKGQSPPQELEAGRIF